MSAQGRLGRWGLVVISGTPSIDQFEIMAEDAITQRSCSVFNYRKQMVPDSLGLIQIHAATDHPVKNHRDAKALTALLDKSPDALAVDRNVSRHRSERAHPRLP